MTIRADIYSPLQNTAVWLGAWLYGHVPADDVLDALNELYGHNYYRAPGPAPIIEMLAQLRRECVGARSEREAGPVLRLVLSGPGDPPALPAGSDSARALTRAGGGEINGAIVVRTAQAEGHLVLVPSAFGTDITVWQAIRESSALPAPAWLSPGDADALLAAATEESAVLIESTGYVSTRLTNPRLTVGTLSDFYDTPGLPAVTPPRAAKLFARADRVAAIIETVTERVGDHSLDPQLLRLGRHIRAARIAGVSYAVNEFAR